MIFPPEKDRKHQSSAFCSLPSNLSGIGVSLASWFHPLSSPESGGWVFTATSISSEHTLTPGRDAQTSRGLSTGVLGI